jgi:Raf kinase inhibitor-like YbhB/YbcL family protein
MEKISIYSKSFENGGTIPAKHTCDGDDVSPDLSWEGVPEGTKSLALIADDPDAPAGTWVHWVLYNIPYDKKMLKEGIPKTDRLIAGNNGLQKTGIWGSVPSPWRTP